MTKQRPTVEDVPGIGVKGERQRVLYLPPPEHGSIRLDSARWFAWLEEASTTSFSYLLFDPDRGYIVGSLTVCKERRQRGGWYWRAVRRVGGRVKKVYLGSSAVVTDMRLAAVAATFLAGDDDAAFMEGPETINVRT
jgi:hypothetical protein